jgi:flagellar motor switch protein FliM
MEKILSQDEINALFSSMSADASALDGSAAKPASAEKAFAKFDFCRSDRIGKDQVRALYQLHTNFARNYSSSLSAYMRSVVEINLISIDQVSYSEFLKLMSDPTLFCALSLAPTHGNFGMELNPPLVFPLIDMLLGGTGKPSAEHRALTDLEIQIIEGVLRLALHDLRESWRPVLDLNLQLAGVEVKPQMLQLVPLSEPVVAICFEVKTGDTSGMLNLCIPSVILKTNRAAFDAYRRPRSSGSESSEGVKISDVLRNAKVSMTTQIRDQVLVVEDLLNISPGDVIQMNHALGDPVQLRIAGVPKFAGRIVVKRGKRALEITHKLVS